MSFYIYIYIIFQWRSCSYCGKTVSAFQAQQPTPHITTAHEPWATMWKCNWSDLYPPVPCWTTLSVCVCLFRVDPIPYDTPKPAGHTRFVCVSDTHSRTDGIQMPYGDVLLHMGDFTELGLPSEVKKFNDWLGMIHIYPHPAGNALFPLTGL